MKKDKNGQRALFMRMKELKEDLYKELELDTKAYEVGLSKEKKRNIIFFFLRLAIFFGIFLVGPFLMRQSINFENILLAASVIVSGIGLYAFIKYEARLSQEGAIMREGWLGFKMYPETAERDRLQNLTPDLFEKYLPYAIIFGVEKKWGKAFEGISMAPPSWYHGVSAGGIAGSSSNPSNFSSGFSASAFSASFASSFSSAFSSSGDGGATSGFFQQKKPVPFTKGAE